MAFFTLLLQAGSSFMQPRTMDLKYLISVNDNSVNMSANFRVHCEARA